MAHELTHVSQAQRGLHFALEGGESQGAPHEQQAEAVESAVHAEASAGGEEGQEGGGKHGGGGGEQRGGRRRASSSMVEEHRAADRGAARPRLTRMSEVVESREQLQHLARDGALRGHTYRDLQATGLRVPAGDFAGSTFERCTLGGADFAGADFSRVDAHARRPAPRAAGRGDRRARQRRRLGPDRARPRRRHARRRRVAAGAGGQPRSRRARG